jgi:hypothetical protein
MDWTARVRFPTGGRHFSLLHAVQTDYGANPASYPMGLGGSFPGGKILWHVDLLLGNDRDQSTRVSRATIGYSNRGKHVERNGRGLI